MTIEKAGALVSRGVGIGLIIISLSSLCSLSFFMPGGMVTSGWTSYSPNSTTAGPTSGLSNAYDVIQTASALYGPTIAQTLAGVLMLFLSRPIGRWLARGLDEPDDTPNG